MSKGLQTRTLGKRLGVRYYLLEPGFIEDSVLYEVRLREVKRMPRYTADQIVEELDRLGVQELIIDSGYPPLIERLRTHFRVKKIFRLKSTLNLLKLNLLKDRGKS